ncbi:MAG TPA: hypothetical protein VIN09_03950 [Chloroflexota bacterium]
MSKGQGVLPQRTAPRRAATTTRWLAAYAAALLALHVCLGTVVYAFQTWAALVPAPAPWWSALAAIPLGWMERGDLPWTSRHALATGVMAATLAALWLLYGRAVRRGLDLGAGDNRALSALVVGAIVFAVPWLLHPRLLSQDVFSYTVYGRMVAHHGANPYADLPSDLPFDPFFDLLYWRDQPSNYGPLWTHLSSVVAAACGDVPGHCVLAFRGLALLGHLAAGVLVWAALGRLRPEDRVGGAALYLWNPLLVVETANSGHNDVAMALFLALGLWLLARGRWHLAAFPLAATVWTKYTTAILLPGYVLLLAVAARHRLRSLGAAALALAAVGLVAWAPFLGGGAGLRSLLEFGTRPQAYNNHPAETLYRWVRQALGEPGQLAWAPFTFGPWWARLQWAVYPAPSPALAATTPPQLLDCLPDPGPAVATGGVHPATPPTPSPPASTVDRREADAASPSSADPTCLPAGREVIVLTPVERGAAFIHDPTSGAYGWSPSAALSARPGVAPELTHWPWEATSSNLVREALPWPGTANQIVRGAALLVYVVVWLACTLRCRSVEGLVTSWLAAVAASYPLLTTWFYPWYILWALPLAALRPRGALGQSVAYFAVATLFLYALAPLNLHWEERWIRDVGTGLVFLVPVALLALNALAGEPGRLRGGTVGALALGAVALLLALPRPAPTALPLEAMSVEALLEEGAASRDRGDLAAAMAAYTEVLRRVPDDARALRERAFLLASRSDPAAVGDLTRLLAVTDSEASDRYHRAQALLRLDRVHEARAEYEAILAIDPDLGWAHGDLARLLYREGYVEAAAAHWRRARSIAPEWAAPWLGLGDVAAYRGEVAEARRAYRIAIWLDPENPLPLDRLARLEARLRRQGVAVELLQEAALRTSSIEEIERYRRAAERYAVDRGGWQAADRGWRHGSG